MVGEKYDVLKMIEDWKQTCQIEKDVHAAVCADEGDGKSHLMAHIVKLLGGNLWDNFVYTGNPEEYYEKYEKLSDTGTSPIAFDEALELIDRINWAKTETKDLVKHVRSRVRKEKKAIYLYGIQLFRDVHGFWRNHRIRYIIELANREWFNGINVGFVMKRSRIPFLTGKRDVWLMDEMEKKWINSMRKGEVLGSEYIRRMKIHPFFKFDFKFQGLDEDTKTEYMRNRQKAYDRYAAVKEESGKVKDVWMSWAILNEEGWSYKQIAERYNRNHLYVARCIKQYRESL